jgi:hypothetical protein
MLIGTGGSGWEFKSPDGPIKEELMLLILTIIPLALGLMVVTMALLKKLRSQPLAEKVAVAAGTGAKSNTPSVTIRNATEHYTEKEKKEVFR